MAAHKLQFLCHTSSIADIRKEKLAGGLQVRVMIDRQDRSPASTRAYEDGISNTGTKESVEAVRFERHLLFSQSSKGFRNRNKVLCLMTVISPHFVGRGST